MRPRAASAAKSVRRPCGLQRDPGSTLPGQWSGAVAGEYVWIRRRRGGCSSGRIGTRVLAGSGSHSLNRGSISPIPRHKRRLGCGRRVTRVSALRCGTDAEARSLRSDAREALAHDHATPCMGRSGCGCPLLLRSGGAGSRRSRLVAVGADVARWFRSLHRLVRAQRPTRRRGNTRA